MEVEENQTIKPWDFASPLHRLQYGIKIQQTSKDERWTFNNLQDGGLSWNLLQFGSDEDEEEKPRGMLL